MKQSGFIAFALFALAAAAMGYAMWQSGAEIEKPSPPREDWVPCEENNDC